MSQNASKENNHPVVSHDTSTCSGEKLEKDQAKDTDQHGHGKKFIESDAGDGTKREDHYMKGVQLFASFASILCVMLLVGLDQTIVMSILEVLTRKFNSTEKISWTLGAFTLGSGVSTQIWGKLSIITGRKFVMIAAVVTFEIGSLICGLAQSMDMLIGGRTIQGLGAGGIQGTAMMITSEMFPINRRSLALAVMSSSMGVSLIIGPFLGGALDKVSWRWCFYINLPIAGVSLAVFFMFYNPPRPTHKMLPLLKGLDYPGMLLFAGGIAMFLVGITLGGAQYAWDSATVLCCIIIGVFVFVLFCVWNSKFSKDRLFPTEVLHTFHVQLASVGLFLTVGSLMVTFQFLSLYFEIIQGKSPLGTAVALLPLICPFILAGVATGILISKTRLIRPVTMVALCLSAISSGILTLLDLNSSLAKRVGLCIFCGFSTGLCMQPYFIYVQVHAPQIPGGTLMSTSYMVVARNIGTSILASFAQVIYTSLIKKTLSSNNVEQLTGYSVGEIISDTSLIPKLSNVAQEIIKKSYMKGIRGTFYFAVSCNALMCCLSLLMSNDKVPRKEDVSQNSRDREEENAKEEEESGVVKDEPIEV